MAERDPRDHRRGAWHEEEPESEEGWGAAAWIALILLLVALAALVYFVPGLGRFVGSTLRLLSVFK